MNNKSDMEETLLIMNSMPFMLLLAMSLMSIFLMQAVWDTISGLYFSYAYEAIVIPYIFYIIWSLLSYSRGDKTNKLKLTLMAIAFAILFIPAKYLILTHQLDINSVIRNTYNPNLNHLPYAYALPFFALAVLFIPYKDFLTNDTNAGLINE